MAKLSYGHPGDNLSPVATGGGVDWVVNTGTGDASYPATNLGDLNPAKPARLTTTTGSWVRDLGSAKQVDQVLIPHHNLTAGLEVRIQANTTSSWGAPPLNELLVVPAYESDGFPVGFFKDLTHIGTRSYQFWRFVVVGTNAAPVAIGEIWLQTLKRQLVDHIAPGMVDTRRRPIVEHVTDYEVATIYDFGVKVRRLVADHMPSPDGRAAILDWWHACHGRAQKTFVIRDPDVNEMLMMRWDENEIAEERTRKLRSTIRLGWLEVSRGLKL
jgi:hypothetical protein